MNIIIYVKEDDDMEEDKFVSYSIKDYLLLGRRDALCGRFYLTPVLDYISIFNRTLMVEIIKNYLIGYRIGIIEVSHRNANESIYFDESTCNLYTDSTKEHLLTTDSVMEVLETKAKRKALSMLGSM